ncbi:MAG TPA: MgtC/SapB family protein [Chthoniobacteraceae bacterium]|nr:MgtC/SapB family protein [Chthoniobacteraceae bacterium]
MSALPFLQIGVALALGLLVGMQRERTGSVVAGVRTFPLITMFGTVCALLAQEFGGWVLAAGLVAMTGMAITANVLKQKKGEVDPGTTTEVAVVLLFAVGALTVQSLELAVIVGGVTVMLLQLKAEMHRIVASIGEREVKAIMQFVVITLVILPVLPRKGYGPEGVLNPFQIWLMVVLIVGISLTGYVLFKLLGTRKGTLIGGMLGGLISSTATTVSFARLSRGDLPAVPALAAVILIASAVTFIRVLALIATVAAPAFPKLAPPLTAMAAIMTVVSGSVFLFCRRQEIAPPEPENPAELKPAIIFGLLYAGVLLLVAVARERFGQAGLYSVAILAGLADMDAITLSTSQLVNAGTLSPDTGWRAVLIAALSNIVVKCGIVAVLGSRGLLWRVAAAFAIAVAAGGAILWLWP